MNSAGRKYFGRADQLGFCASQSSLNSVREIFLKTVWHESIQAISDFPRVVQDHYCGKCFHFHEGVESVRIDDGQIPLLALHKRRYGRFVLVRVYRVEINLRVA